MATRTGGTNVRTGFYWNLGKWEMVTVPRQGGLLPGVGADRYLKVPMVAMLGLAPLMGGLYVMFLPFIGFAMVLGWAARQLGDATRTGFMELATVVAPHWQPGEAYLAAKKARKATRDRQDTNNSAPPTSGT
jgi:hypothetical protein